MTILVTSSYRSYEYQVKLYNQYAEENSKEEADTYSARPGYSEHQTGLAVDIHNGKKFIQISKIPKNLTGCKKMPISMDLS